MPKSKYFFNYDRYQMRAADYYLMLKDQDGVCAICAKPPLEGKRLVIDHDHSAEGDDSGVRGLLCDSCNLLLGHAKDNIEVLEEAKNYLKNGGHCSRFYIETAKLIELKDPGL